MRNLTCRLAALAASTIILAGLPGAAASKGVRLEVSKDRYVVSTTVVVKFVNDSNRTVLMTRPWSIERVRGGDVVAEHFFQADELEVSPGGKRIWRWDQVTAEGEPARAGGYRARMEADDIEYSDGFDIGRFFTLGFEQNDASFVVFVARQKAMEQMEEEAEAEDKTLITSGIVRRGERYNPDWSYTMGPRTIVLGEAFIEVCDASPQYVEKNRGDWLGERWCPWSSYVDHVGK